MDQTSEQGEGSASPQSAPDELSFGRTENVMTFGEDDANNTSDDEASRLRNLAAEVVDQDELERNIGRQVSRYFSCSKQARTVLNLFHQADHLLTGQANERDKKRLEKTQADKAYV